MKNLLSLFVVLLGFNLQAQSLSVELSSDSILLGNTVKVNFKIEDTDGEFEAPDFENMQIISGPNYSSSVQIINGDMTSKKTISFYIRPNEVGQFYISPAYVVDEDYTLETQPIAVNVFPNPDGIIEEPVMENSFIFDGFGFEWPEHTFEKPKPPRVKKSKSDQPLRKI